MKSGNADVYENEIPGGQYTNLHFQVPTAVEFQISAAPLIFYFFLYFKLVLTNVALSHRGIIRTRQNNIPLSHHTARNVTA